mmetsp:Transcript_16738/g.25569  ORF Transcript_16738/g.25569 Transcript_16738/m.25569 type:complete len:249 (-) Transcript_16738:98-844(-)
MFPAHSSALRLRRSVPRSGKSNAPPSYTYQFPCERAASGWIRTMVLLAALSFVPSESVHAYNNNAPGNVLFPPEAPRAPLSRLESRSPPFLDLPAPAATAENYVAPSVVIQKMAGASVRPREAEKDAFAHDGAGHLRGGRRKRNLQEYEFSDEEMGIAMLVIVLIVACFCCCICSCLMSCLSQCCCGGNQQYHQGGYYNQGYGGPPGYYQQPSRCCGCFDCFRDILACFCCYELLCTDDINLDNMCMV